MAGVQGIFLACKQNQDDPHLMCIKFALSKCSLRNKNHLQTVKNGCPQISFLTYTRMCTCTHKRPPPPHTHTQKHTQKHTHTYTHTHIHTHTHCSPCKCSKHTNSWCAASFQDKTDMVVKCFTHAFKDRNKNLDLSGDHLSSQVR